MARFTRKDPRFDSEAELAKTIIEWLKLQHWEVWQEIPAPVGSSVNDIVAKRGPVVWVIECKKSFSLKVVEQAWWGKGILRSVAVPYYSFENSGRLLTKICKDYGVGIITSMKKNDYAGDPSGGRHGIKFPEDPKFCYDINEYLAPAFQRHNKRYLPQWKTILDMTPKDFAIAGAQNGKYYTPYKRTLEEVKRYLANKSTGASIKEIVDSIDHHYANDNSAKCSLKKALQEWEDFAAWKYADKTLMFSIKAEGETC